MHSYANILRGGIESPSKSWNLNSALRVSANVQRICGTISQNSPIFPEERRNSQCTSNAVMAVCMSKFVALNSWTQDTVDTCLLQGDELHAASCASYLNRFGQNPPQYLAADEVLSPVFVSGQQLNVSFPLDAFQGNLPSLQGELEKFFESYEHGILTCSLLSLAVFKSTTQYALFDSHSRNKEGLAISDGTALLSIFQNLEDMVSLLNCHFEQNNNLVFSISPVVIANINSDLPVNVNNVVSLPAQNDTFVDSSKSSTVPSDFSRLNAFKNRLQSKKNRIAASMRKLRENSDFREKEKSVDLTNKRLQRQNPDVREKERLKEAEGKRTRRQNPEVRNEDNLKQVKAMRARRQNPDVREKERLKEAERKKTRQQNPEVRNEDKLKHVKEMRARRQIPGVREKERLKEAERKEIRQQNPEVRNEDKLKHVKEMRARRQIPGVREKEKLKEAERKEIRQQNPEVRNEDKLKHVKEMRARRQIPDVREKERLKEAERKEIRRQNPAVRNEDNLKHVKEMRARRQNPDVREKEILKKTKRKEIRQQNPEVRNEDKLKHVQEMRARRQNPTIREAERHTEILSKQQKRQHDFFKFREQCSKKLCSSKTEESDRLQFEIIKSRSNMPELVCAYCSGLFFKHSIVTLNLEKLKEKLTETEYDTIINSVCDSSGLICRTCLNYISKGKIPKLATVNGLKFPTIPPCLKDLSPLEERMVAPYINFMQIRPLKPNALNPQLGLKGSVVNIPVEVNEMLQVLPRQFNEMATIQVKLKRHVSHSSDYMYETVRPLKIIAALDYLEPTTLYRKHKVSTDKSFRTKYGQSNVNIDFIVDDNDAVNPNLETNASTDDPDDPSEFDEEENEDVDAEVLLLDRDKEMRDRIKVMAPGQGKTPVPWHLQADLEELSFPTIFCGQPFEPKSHISYAERAKSEARRSDRRSCVSSRILYMAKKKLELACFSSVNIFMRKNRKTSNLTAAKVCDMSYRESLLNDEAGYRVLDHIRSSPSYWEQKKKVLMATIRQLGRPTFFLTLSAAESKWPELIQCLAKLNWKKKISLEEAFAMDAADKTTLIRMDPVTCARYFDYKATRMIWLLKQNAGPFLNHFVTDSYERVEFQVRGSPHEHVFLWLKNAPVFDPSDPQSIADCIAFIDEFITCEYDENNPFIIYVLHRHSFTCYKGKKFIKLCRFQFPIPPMPRTMILFPLDKDLKTEDVNNNLKKIRELSTDLFKKPRKINFDNILKELDMTEEQYVIAVRSSLKRCQVFLKRGSLEVGINAYNKIILNLFEANIDLQFILEEFGVANYMINYVTKVDAGMSKMLREAANDIREGYLNVRDKLRNIANVFINGNLMSSQEAAYHVLSLPLSKSSRSSVFVNTSPIAERVRMLKLNVNLRKLDPNSTDIYLEDIHSKYSDRPTKLNDICLADFATLYNVTRRRGDEINDDEEDKYSYVKRGERKILRYRRYKEFNDPLNYCREQICLFLPWRVEADEVENCNVKEKYSQNLSIIEENRAKFSILPDAILDEAMNVALDENRALEEEEEDEFLNDQLATFEKVDIFQQGGQSKSREIQENRFSIPQKINSVDLQALFRKLNPGQRQIVMHVLHSMKTSREPLRIFMSGSAGVGKSFVINTIYQAVTRHFDNLPGENIDSIKVLLCAFSGKAAFLINGVTLHTAFALPISQYGGQMRELSNDLASSIRQNLIHLKLLIIDEISMVGSRLFHQVDQRLRQVMGRPELSFGGVSVIVVGDLNQLIPVGDSQIFVPPRISEMSVFLQVNPLWEEFRLYELTQIMRQRNEQLFITALNNLASGSLTTEDMNLLKTREFSEAEIPDEAIRLYSWNSSVDAYNQEKIAKMPGPEYVVRAKDSVLGKVTENQKKNALTAILTKKYSEVGGLSTEITLKINIKYMITANIDVQDGLVNGACGELKLITYKPNTSEIDKIWLDLGSEATVGRKQRLAACDFMINNNIDRKLTPISRKTHSATGDKESTYQVLRQQFPVVPAEAMTVHKSQGQTYQSVCVDLDKCKRISRAALYVALSRVTSLTGLFIIGNLKKPKAPADNDPVKSELRRLRLDPLQLSFWNMENKSGLVLVYHNVSSLHQHINDISADDWYSRCDIVIFAETRSLPSDVFQFTNFKVVCRCDSGNERYPRGLLCIAKNDLNVSEVSVNSEDDLNHKMDVMRFKVGDTFIVSGYKPPNTPVSFFRNVMERIIPDHPRVIILGDFNFNIIGHEETSLMPFMLRYKLTPALDPLTSTTNFNTQIDVIFSNFSLNRTGVYESYFSDHKAIYCEILPNDL